MDAMYISPSAVVNVAAVAAPIALPATHPAPGTSFNRFAITVRPAMVAPVVPMAVPASTLSHAREVSSPKTTEILASIPTWIGMSIAASANGTGTAAAAAALALAVPMVIRACLIFSCIEIFCAAAAASRTPSGIESAVSSTSSSSPVFGMVWAVVELLVDGSYADQVPGLRQHLLNFCSESPVRARLGDHADYGHVLCERTAQVLLGSFHPASRLGYA